MAQKNCHEPDYFRAFSATVVYEETLSAQPVTAGFISGRIIAGLFYPSLPFLLNFPKVAASSEAAPHISIVAHYYCIVQIIMGFLSLAL